MEDENSLIVLIDLLASHNEIETVIVLSQTCTFLYQRSSHCIKTLLNHYEVLYNDHTFKDCYEIIKIEEAFKESMDEYYDRCIYYDRNHRIKDVLKIFRDNIIYITGSLNRCDFVEMEELEKIDKVMEQVNEEVTKHISELLHKAYYNKTRCMNVVDAIIKAEYHNMEDEENDVIFKDIFHYYIEADDVEMTRHLIKPIRYCTLFRDCYKWCKSEEMFLLLYKEFNIDCIPRDVDDMVRDRNVLLIDCAMKYGYNGLKVDLVNKLIKEEDLSEEVFDFLDSKDGFSKYLEIDTIRRLVRRQCKPEVENICKYGSVKDKIMVLECVLDIDEDIRNMLDLLFEHGRGWDYFRDRNDVKGNSRKVRKELLRRMKDSIRRG